MHILTTHRWKSAAPAPSINVAGCDPQTASDMGKLDQGAIDRVRDEAWPRVENADELHDALVELGYVTSEEGAEWQTVPCGIAKRSPRSSAQVIVHRMDR